MILPEELQCHPNHLIRLIRQKEQDIQYIAVQLQTVQGEVDAEFDLFGEHLLELAQSTTGGVCVGFDPHGEDVILSLDEEVHLVGRAHMTPVARHDLELGYQG